MNKFVFIILLIALFSSVTSANEYDEILNDIDIKKQNEDIEYGVFKKGVDHVITVFGFSDDFEVCIEIIEMLNRKQAKTYTCIPLTK